MTITRRQERMVDDFLAQPRRNRERTLAEKEKAWPRTVAKMARLAMNKAGCHVRSERMKIRAAVLTAYSWKDFGRHIVEGCLRPRGTLARSEYSFQIDKATRNIAESVRSLSLTRKG